MTSEMKEKEVENLRQNTLSRLLVEVCWSKDHEKKDDDSDDYPADNDSNPSSIVMIPFIFVLSSEGMRGCSNGKVRLETLCSRESNRGSNRG